jgi:hypothetical protein
MIWILLYFYVIFCLTLLVISDWQNKSILDFILGYMLISVILPIYLIVMLFAFVIVILYILVYPIIFLVQILRR